MLMRLFIQIHGKILYYFDRLHNAENDSTKMQNMIVQLVEKNAKSSLPLFQQLKCVWHDLQLAVNIIVTCTSTTKRCFRCFCIFCHLLHFVCFFAGVYGDSCGHVLFV